MIRPINGLDMANQSGIASRKGSESCLRQSVLAIGIVERADASRGCNRLRERIAFMGSSLDDDSIPANALVWDFAIARSS
jgi:hypothetical protein